MLTLYASKGCGSALVEAFLELVGVDYERREVAYGIHDPAAAELRQVNPLGQVPTLVLDDGSVMTESAAIALWLMDGDDAGVLGPGPGQPDRARFLRWLIYFPAAIYPMYTVGDEPERWAGDDAAARLREASVERILLCWRTIEEQLGPGDYLLGDRLSALDVYAAMMSRWRPGRDRIRAVAPRAIAAAERAETHPVIARVVARNM